MPGNAVTPALSLAGIGKRFGAMQANEAINLEIESGSIHGLVGENGAGKSTLMSIVAGLLAPDEGTLSIDGRPIRFRNPAEARASGIGMVHQHFMLVDRLDALDNILLGESQGWWLPAARRNLRQRIAEIATTHGLAVPLDVEVGQLSVGERQRIEILKALVGGARILILDEPTAVLTPHEVDALFAMMRAMRDRGCSVVLVSHKLQEILSVTDRVSVLRRGRLVETARTCDVTAESLARAMMGHDVPVSGPTTEVQAGADVLVAEGLHLATGLTDVSLRLRAGEILGVAGISGNGQTELLECLSGLQRLQAGHLKIGDYAIDIGSMRVETLRQYGIAYVPEDRMQALVAQMPARDQFRLGHEAPATDDLLRLLKDWDVRPPDPDQLVQRFSGGNQQKLILARELRQLPRILLIAQPTRGVDLGGTGLIHDRLRALRAGGSAILLVSSDLDELLSLSDRIVVLHRGRLAGACKPAQVTREQLGLMMAGDSRGLAA